MKNPLLWFAIYSKAEPHKNIPHHPTRQSISAPSKNKFRTHVSIPSKTAPNKRAKTLCAFATNTARARTAYRCNPNLPFHFPATPSTSVSQLHLCSHRWCSVWALQNTSSWCRHRTLPIEPTSTIEIRCSGGDLLLPVPQDQVGFQSSSNVMFVLNGVTTSKPTVRKREELHCKIPSVLQSNHYTLLEPFILYF